MKKQETGTLAGTAYIIDSIEYRGGDLLGCALPVRNGCKIRVKTEKASIQS